MQTERSGQTGWPQGSAQIELSTHRQSIAAVHECSPPFVAPPPQAAVLPCSTLATLATATSSASSTEWPARSETSEACEDPREAESSWLRAMRPTHLVAIFAFLMVIALIRIYQILMTEVYTEQAMPVARGTPPSGGNYRGDGGRIASNLRG